MTEKKNEQCSFVNEIPSSKSSSQLSSCSSGDWRARGSGWIFSTSPSGPLITDPLTLGADPIFHAVAPDESCELVDVDRGKARASAANFGLVGECGEFSAANGRPRFGCLAGRDGARGKGN
jgi:hypothetical protein